MHYTGIALGVAREGQCSRTCSIGVSTAETEPPRHTFGGFTVNIFGHVVNLLVGDIQENLCQQHFCQHHLQKPKQANMEPTKKSHPPEGMLHPNDTPRAALLSSMSFPHFPLMARRRQISGGIKDSRDVTSNGQVQTGTDQCKGCSHYPLHCSAPDELHNPHLCLHEKETCTSNPALLL